MALTGNFLIDTGMQEQTATPVSGYKPNPTEEVIKNLASPTETIPKTRTQEQLFSDMKKLEQSGFTGSQEELLKEVVGYAKSKGITFDGVNSDEILGIMQEPVQEEEIEIEEDMEGLDIGLEVSEGLQELGKGLKVESKFDIKPMSETTGVVDTFKNEGKRLLNSLRFAANLPGDTIEMAGELIGVASNVVGTARSVKDIGVGIADKLGLVEGTEEQQAMVNGIGQVLSDNFGTAEDAIETINQNPLDTLTSIFGGAGLAKSGLKTTKFAQTTKGQSLINKLSKIEDITNPLNVVKGELALGKKAIKTGVGTPAKLLGQGFVKTTGVNLDTVSAIVKNPKIFKQAETGTITRQSVADDIVKAVNKKAEDVSDIGKKYTNIRKLKSNIKPTEIKSLKAGINNYLRENDIGVLKGKLNFNNSKIGSTGNRNAIQKAYELIQKRTKYSEGKDWLNLRQSIDDTINWKSEATTRGETIVRGLRGKVDDVAKDKLKGLKELDAKFAPERGEYNRISKLIYDKSGELKDNYISTIANITGKGKELKLERLKQISPQLEVQVKALKALEDITLAKGNKIGSYMNAGVVGGSFATGGLPSAVAAYIITHPSTLVNVLKTYTGTKTIINSILNKVKVGTKLNAKESIMVGNAIKSQIKEIGTIEGIPLTK